MSGFRISIITVNLNNRQGLERTLKSILDQDAIKPEVIVIDGGSTDGSLDIIRDFEQVGLVTYHESGKDKGIYDAMNRGVMVATGDFVQFLNSGDTLNSNDVIYNLYCQINELTADIYYADAIVTETGERISYTERIDRKFLFFKSLCHQSIIYNAKVFDVVGNYDLTFKILADRDHLYRAFMKRLRFHHIDIPLVLWERAGYSSKNMSIYVDEIKLFYTKYYSCPERILLKIARKLEMLLSTNG